MVVRVVVPGLGAVEGAVVVVLVVGAVRRTVVVVAGVRTVGVTAPHAADVGHRSQGLRLDRGRFRLRRGRGDRLRFRRGLRLGLHRRRGPDCRRVVGLFVVVLVVVTGLGAVEGAIMVVLIIRAVHGAVVVVAGVRAVGIGTPHPGHKGHGARLRRRLLWSSARRLAAASGQQEYQCQQADPNLIVPHMDEDMPALYSAADLFVFPSLYEGFGIPVIEAQACGTPVLASSGSALPEVGGDGAVYVEPYDIEDISNGILQVLQNPALMEQLRQNGLSNARRFSWRTSAEHLDRVIEKAVSE